MEGAADLKLDMGVLQGGLAGPWHRMRSRQQCTSHWEGQWENREEGGMRMKNRDDILNSALVVTMGVYDYYASDATLLMPLSL